jgi:hypothetical protein|tara:strand:- start:1340 stop:1837 length:498 start_codon:yes stop_codon:yes gene_type:complete
MANLDSLEINNEYFTCKEAWMDVLHHLDRSKIYLDPFYGDGGNIQNLRDLGLNVIGADLDCFELLRNLNFDVIITNPAFSKNILTEFLYNLSSLDKPFIIILPITKIFSKYFKTAFRQYKSIQLIIPKNRMRFNDPRRPGKKSNPSFVCAYITYKLDLPSDILFL